MSHLDPSELAFNSRRSPVLCTRGAVTCAQPQAARIGLEVLRKGGNAVDACVAMAAALNVTEPSSTGIGGDCFALIYDPVTRKVSGINGSGRAPSMLSIDKIPVEDQFNGRFADPTNANCVTVPGTVDGWCDALEKFGSLSLSDVLSPSIELADRGFAVEPWCARAWKASEALLQRKSGGHQLLIDGHRAPQTGEVFKNPNLANTFRLIAEHGRSGFYEGPVAAAIVDVCRSQGGMHTLEDLKSHQTTFPEAISVNYKGINVHEIPPNGQGLTALLAFNILKQLNPPLEAHPIGSAEHLHLLIEAFRLAFADTRYYVADSDHTHVPVQELLSEEYAKQRAALINRKSASPDVKYGSPVLTSNTVGLCAVDEKGMACSFLNSNYMGFGTGLAPADCGFTLQNRGYGFSLDATHPNALVPNKRPYHTIIPGMATTDSGDLYAAFCVTQQYMQPQGHVQVLTSMLNYGFNAQQALDLPRFCIESGEAGGHVLIEDGISEEVLEQLKALGHDARRLNSWQRNQFGRGQVIHRAPNGVLWCGSDGRADGCAMGY